MKLPKKRENLWKGDSLIGTKAMIQWIQTKYAENSKYGFRHDSNQTKKNFEAVLNVSHAYFVRHRCFACYYKVVAVSKRAMIKSPADS